MHLVRIDHAAGKPASYRTAISDGVQAMGRTFNVPDDDRFQVIGRHAPAALPGGQSGEDGEPVVR